MGKLSLFLAAAACVGLLALATGCSSRAAQSDDKSTPAPLVELATVGRKDVPIQIEAFGSVEPYLTVAVRARVSGQILKVHFKQGADVSENDLLFQIDPRPYQIQVDQAKATLARDMAAEPQSEAAAVRDRATARNARADAARYAALFKQGIVSREQFDQSQSTGDAAEAAVKADEASIAVAGESVQLDRARLADAELQLSYTQIRAPITGRTGNLNVQQGNLVKDQDSTPLVVINQISPVYVAFSVPEGALPDIRRHSRTGHLRVGATPPQASAQVDEGVLDFIDNKVDTATGTIKLKAVFQNADHQLWPGQFVNITLNLATEAGVAVVPSAAVQTGQNGKYVFVVDSNRVAHERAVQVGPITGGDTVIRSGIAPGELVVTDGQLGVVDGARVQPAKRQSTGNGPLAP